MSGVNYTDPTLSHSNPHIRAVSAILSYVLFFYCRFKTVVEVFFTNSTRSFSIWLKHFDPVVPLIPFKGRNDVLNSPKISLEF